jgi:hypothetical protein
LISLNLLRPRFSSATSARAASVARVMLSVVDRLRHLTGDRLRVRENVVGQTGILEHSLVHFRGDHGVRHEVRGT